jgi:magnesium chelatase subunit D
MTIDFPMSAIVGQDDLKLALLLVAVDPTIGGVLISGERGTAKSTAARALASLLPMTAAGAAPFVELPLGATEDRVVGSIDVSKVLKDGSAELRPGLLARAHGGVLYVDEVNLLPDHIVDLLLDSAASGWVTIERDGLSTGQPARFVLIGTMNPEEGELRPQFLDRFGLCVRIQGPTDVNERIAAVRQRVAFDDAPETVVQALQTAERQLRDSIVAARDRLRRVVIDDGHLRLVADIVAERATDGIRGDLATIKAARALAAWEASTAIEEQHIRRAAEFALTHRVPRSARPNRRGTQGASASAPNKPTGVAGAPPPPSSKSTPPAGEGAKLQKPSATAQNPNPIHLSTEEIDREQAGRRNIEAVGAVGRIVGTRAFDRAGTGALAINETVRAAATRGARVGAQGVALVHSDLRQHERAGTGRCHVLFLVDASGSMAVQQRITLAKQAASGLLTSSYQRRDEVALMVFRGEGTDLILPFTRDVRRVEDALREVPTGGRTPLARALLDAAHLLQTREPSLLVLLTDGRANVSVGEGDPWAEAQAACATLASACAGALVIDCESGPISLGRARVLATVLNAEVVALNAIDVPQLLIQVNRRVESL